MKKIYILKEFDSKTRKCINFEITNKGIYDQFRRSKWKIEYHDNRFKKHTIPFSALIGGDDGAYEYFHEFITYESNPEHVLITKDNRLLLCKAINLLDESERIVIILYYYDGLTEDQIAAKFGVNQSTISRRKNRRKKTERIFKKH